MDAESIVNLIVAILTGLATAVPLVYAVIKKTKDAVNAKNWPYLLGAVTDLMITAEEKFADGATRKEWVLAMVQTTAEYVNYPVDVTFLSEMIDELIAFTKKVNPPAEVENVAG